MATLDRKLKRIAEENSTKAGEQPQSQDRQERRGLPPGLLERTQSLLGGYLAEKLFPSYDRGVIGAFLRSVAPYVMTIEPEKGGEAIRWYVYLDVDEDTARLILSALGADGLADELIPKENAGAVGESTKRRAKRKDYVSLVDLAESVIPGAGVWNSLVDIIETKCEVSEEGLVAPHPYLLAMGMKPEHRPLAVAAMDYGIMSGELSGWEDAEDSLAGILACIPTLAHLTAAAASYGIADVKPCIKDLNRVVELYSTRWGRDTDC